MCSNIKLIIYLQTNLTDDEFQFIYTANNTHVCCSLSNHGAFVEDIFIILPSLFQQAQAIQRPPGFVERVFESFLAVITQFGMRIFLDINLFIDGFSSPVVRVNYGGVVVEILCFGAGLVDEADLRAAEQFAPVLARRLLLTNRVSESVDGCASALDERARTGPDLTATRVAPSLYRRFPSLSL